MTEDEILTLVEEALGHIDQPGLISGNIMHGTSTDSWTIRFWLGWFTPKITVLLDDKDSAVDVIEQHVREVLPGWIEQAKKARDE